MDFSKCFCIGFMTAYTSGDYVYFNNITEIPKKNRTNLRVHFVHRHAQGKIVISEEGKRTYPRFPTCDIFASHKNLKIRHLATAF